VLYGCGATRYTCLGDLEADATSIRKWKDTKSSNNIYYQIFAVLQRPRAGQQRRVVNMFELPLCAAKAYGKPPPEGQKRILQADQADGLSGIKGKNHKGFKTLLISDGARCYPKLARKKSLLHRACSHSKGIFSGNKRLPTRGWTKIHTVIRQGRDALLDVVVAREVGARGTGALISFSLQCLSDQVPIDSRWRPR